MAKRRAKKMVRQANTSHGSNVSCVNAKVPQVEAKEDGHCMIEQEVQRQFSAIRAVRDMEIEQLLTGVHLLRSYLKKEQLQTTALQFFNENLPNLTVLKNEGNGQFELQWNNEDDNLSQEHANGGDLHASLLHHMSIVYPDHSAASPSFAGYELCSKTVKTSLGDVDNLHIRDFVLEEAFGTHMLGAQDSLEAFVPSITSRVYMPTSAL